MDKNYVHKKYEESLYRQWESSGAFKPAPTGELFSIIMPPPNANGDLHLGHALMLTVEDIMCRYARLEGKSVLWLPGADHAGFETQVVYEKVLEKEGRSRLEMSPAELYREIWQFTQTNKKNMEGQIRRLGASCDWSREKFTLDRDVIETVYATFTKLVNDGLMYRGVRLVNYSPKFRTSFSDLEITHEEQTGQLTYILYLFVDGEIDGKKGITVATTRPETILGDQAVAVNPKDRRYQKMVGQMVKLPLTDREIPIVADELVDQKFATGAVKITPAHDFNDFEIGQRHQLELLQVIGFDGKMTDAVPTKYRGLKATTEARELVLADLRQLGAIVKEEPHIHQVPMGYKGGAIEPLPLEQWFVKMDAFAKRVRELIESKKITIYPARYQKVLFEWLDHIRDWNVSRQIAWGIPIPVWYCADATAKGCPPIVSTKIKANTPDDHGVSPEDLEPPTKCPHCGSTKLRQESDTFDTWFSSGQWIFATLPDPDRWLPTTVLETAADIIFFWVARMIFMTDYVTGKIPFKHVYLHGLVLDPKGQKMSKSKGNVLNPIEIIDKYGADALRMGLVAGNVAGSNQAFAEDKAKAYRNFANKIWNMGRFIETRLPEGQTLAVALKPYRTANLFSEPSKSDQPPTPPAKTEADKQLLQDLAKLEQSYREQMGKWQYWLVTEELYHFAWHTFADVYIETAKKQTDVDNTNAVLLYVYSRILWMLSPFMPFLTEAISG